MTLSRALIAIAAAVVTASPVGAQLVSRENSTTDEVGARVERDMAGIGLSRDPRVGKRVLRRLETRVRTRIDRYYTPLVDPLRPLATDASQR